MAPSPDMQTIAGRLASFDGPKQVNKRRPSAQKKKQPTTSSWPHESPTPEQLAKAGFFYKPSSSSPDSVTCFLCNKALDGWDTDDNPALEHLNHVPDCGWAINCCIEQRLLDMDSSEEDPLSQKMIDARRATYNDWWPHEKKKGWKCKTKKMVDAGWCYTPIPEADDCVTCFYCGASLEGWEPKDDPWHEHRKRASDCHFFTLVEESTRLKKASKSKKGRGSTTSKASRQSVQSTTTVGVDESVLRGDDEPATEEGDSIMSAATTASKAGPSRKKAPRSKTATKKGKKGAQSHPSTADESVISQQIEAELENEVAEPEQDQAPSAGSPKQTRNRRQVHTSAQTATSNTKPKSIRGRKATDNESTPLETSDGANAQDEHEPEAPPSPPPKETRGRKRRSDGSEKLEQDSVVVLVSPPKPAVMDEHEHSPILDSLLQKKQETDDDIAARAPTPSPKQPKKTSKGKKKKKFSKADEEQADQGFEETDTNLGRMQATREAEGQSQGARRSLLKSAIPEPQQEATPPPGDDEPPNRSPTPQSSDAENQPPSSRPPSSKRKTPILPLTSQTPRLSPSKRNMIPGDQLSRDSWKPIDLDGVFLPSPSYAQLGNKDAFNIETIVQTLTSDEKQLTVEDWIKKNAGQAEDRLQQECERMIGKFEDEGNRALTSMEGIECA